MPSLVFEKWVPAPIQRVWDDHAQPGTLWSFTPKIGRMQLLAPDEGIVQGNLIHFRIRLAGISLMTWKGRYELVEAPIHFHDTAISGPYKSWSHHHRFLEKDGGTVVRDEIEYTMKFGPLGPLADFLVARRLLNGLFKYRHERLDEMYPG